MRLSDALRGLAARRPTVPHAYRPEIDGLRAIAIIPVVLYHAHVPLISGGYVGVDVFFVISGYLITLILGDDIARGNFSILTFYERRVRRIFPALFVVLIASTVLAGGLLLAEELEDYSRSLLSTTLFLSNFHFMGDAGYFNAPAETKPLLHTWSLAVEEQFYIFFPVYIYVMARFRKRWLLPTTLALLALSLLACIILTPYRPEAAFYASPIRAWELLTGCVLALITPRSALPAALAQWMGAVGLAMIGIAVFTFTDATVFPGAYALVPVVGAALVIHASTANAIGAGALLSLAPMRFVGLISYSLYLWHWPILVFYRVWRIEHPSALEIAGLIAISVVLSVLSWWFVERPFRWKTLLSTRPRTLAAGSSVMAAGVALATIVILNQGFPNRYPDTVRQMLIAKGDKPKFDACSDINVKTAGLEGAALEPWRQVHICPLGAPKSAVAESEATFALWGDSHAGALSPGINAAARQLGMHGVFLGRGGCVPLLGVNQIRPGFDNCSDLAAAILSYLKERPNIRRVILASRWSIYAMGDRYGNETGNRVLIRDGEVAAPSPAHNGDVFMRGFARTLTALEEMGREVVVVTQVPETEYDIPSAMARARWFGRNTDLAPKLEDYRKRQAFVTGLFDQAVSKGRMMVFHVERLLCGHRSCSVADGDRPIYIDSNHLTTQYAASLTEALLPLLHSTAAK